MIKVVDGVNQGQFEESNHSIKPSLKNKTVIIWRHMDACKSLVVHVVDHTAIAYKGHSSMK